MGLGLGLAPVWVWVPVGAGERVPVPALVPELPAQGAPALPEAASGSVSVSCGLVRLQAPEQPAQQPPQRRITARELWVSVAAVGLIVVAGVVGFAVFSGEAANQRTLPDYVGQTWDAALDDINGKWLVRRYELRRDATSVGESLVPTA